MAIGCTILAVELLYFVAPNVKQRFVSTLPGALIAVGGWIGLSYLLGIYFQDFSAYSKGYGSLGVALAFSIWLYWTGFVVLIGAQFNAELLQEARGRPAPEAKRRAEPSLGRVSGGNMAEQEWTVKELMEALKKFPPDAKVYYEMGPNGAGTIGKAQYVKARGEDDEMGVLLDR